jgi:hypothetical protein
MVVQGKPVARRGRKARDLRFREDEDRPAAVIGCGLSGGNAVKANLARFTVVLTLLASMALTLGAGFRWG